MVLKILAGRFGRFPVLELRENFLCGEKRPVDEIQLLMKFNLTFRGKTGILVRPVTQ
jgi:hypothetical protein